MIYLTTRHEMLSASSLLGNLLKLTGFTVGKQWVVYVVDMIGQSNRPQSLQAEEGRY